MSNIDQRIVEMDFKNKQFEDGIKESLNSLDSLKKGLGDFDSNKTGLSGIADGIGAIAEQFSALGIIGITVLQNLTNRVIDLSIELLKGVTLDPIMSGFEKYEQKIGSVQTIMAATGLSIDEVNESLNKLIWFTDETSYSFTDMVASIGTFTSAGVDLDVAVDAMQGIANWAAISGANTQTASSAMNVMSKAIGQGSVKLREWQSISTYMNMGTVEFKQTVLDTAVAMGTLTDQGDGFYKTMQGNEVTIANFSEFLKDAWFNTDVLLSVLGEYGEYATEVFEYVEEHGGTAAQAMEILGIDTERLGAKAFKAAQEAKTFTDALEATKDAVSSGWMTTFELVLGDYVEAKELWTDVADALWDMFAAGGEARNELLELWKEMDGRDMLIEGVANAFNALFAILEPVKNAFRDIFPEMTAERLVELTEKFRNFTEGLIISEETADKLQRTFAGVFAVFDILGTILGSVFTILTRVLSIFAPLTGYILDATAAIGDFIVGLRDAVKDGDIFGGFVEKVVFVLNDLEGFLHMIGDGILRAINKIGEYFGFFSRFDLSSLKIFTNNVERAFTPFTWIGNVVTGAMAIIVGVFQKAWPVIGPIVQALSNVIRTFVDSVGEVIRNGDFRAALDLLNGGILVTIVLAIRKFVDSLSSVTANASGFLSSVTSILDGVRGSLEAYQTKLKAQALLNIAAAIGILAVSLLVISTIPSDKLTGALAGISALFIELSLIMGSVSKLSGGTLKLASVATTMIALATAILILAAAMKKLADLTWDDIAEGTVAIGILSTVLIKSASNLSASTPKLTKGSVGLIAMATAIVILTTAVEKLGALEWGELAKGLIGVVTLLTSVAAFTNLIKPEKLVSTGVAMIAMGAGLNIIATAVEKLGALEIEQLQKGLGAIAALLATIGAFTQITKPDKIISVGLAMIAMGAALNILYMAVESFSGLSMDEIGRGLLALAGSLAGIGVFTQIVKTDKILATGVALIAMGAALNIIAKAMKSFSGMSWEEIQTGLVALGGTLGILALAVNLMTGALPGAAAITIVSAALLLLAPALMMLGSMDLIEIGVALVALSGVFAVVGASAVVLAPLAPVILTLSAAIALLGVATFGIGAGLLAFSAGLTSLAVAGTAGVAALVVVVTSILNLIPLLLEKLGEGVIAFAKVITDGIPAIVDAVKAIAVGLVQVITEIIPMVVEAVLVFLGALLEQLADSLPDMIESGARILLAILQGIKDHIYDIVVVALEIIAEFLQGIAEGLPGIISAGVDIVIAFIDSVANETPRLIDAGFKMIVDFVNGLADAIRDNTPLLVDAFRNLGMAMIEGLIEGVTGMIGLAVDAVKSVGSAVIDGFKNVLGIQSPSKVMAAMGVFVTEGLSKGVEQGTPNTMKAMKTFAMKTAIATSDELGIKQGVSSRFKEMGENVVESFNEGVRKSTPYTKKEIKNFADTAVDTITDVFGNFKKFQTLGINIGHDFVAGLNSIGDNVTKAMIENLGLDESEAEQFTKFIDSAMSTMTERLESYTQAASNHLSKIDTEVETTVKDMIENLQHNQKAIEQWAYNIEILASRGLNEGLLEQLRSAGPESAAQVKAIVQATDAEFQELNVVLGNAGSVAAKAMVASLQGGKSLIVDEAEDIIDVVDDTADTVTGSMKEYSKFGGYTVSSYNAGFEKEIPAAENSAKTFANKVSTAVMNGLGIKAGFSKVFEKVGMASVFGFNSGVQDSIKLSEETMNKFTDATLEAAYESLNKHDAMKHLGINTAGDFMEGLDSMSEAVKATLFTAFGLDEETITELTGNMDEALSVMESRIEAYTDLASERFSRLDTDVEISVREMIDNMKWNQIAMLEWAENIEILTARGVNEGLINQLREAGPKSASEVKSLIEATDAELQELNEVMGSAGAVAIETLAQTLPKGQPLIVQEGEELIDALARAIAGSDSVEEAIEIMMTAAWENGLDPSLYGDSVADNIMYMIMAIADSTDEIVETSSKLNKEATKELASADTDYKDVGEQLIKAMDTGFKNKLPDLLSTCKALMRQCISELASAYEDFYKTGQRSISGFVEGMRSKIEDAARMAAEIARAAYQAAMAELDIHSPSRKMLEVGKFFVMGFANGIEKFSPLAEEEAKQMSSGVKGIFEDVLSTLMNVLDVDMDMSPTITPVIDMDDLNKGIKNINQILNGTQLDLSTTLDVTANASRAIANQNGSNLLQNDTTPVSEVKNFSFVQNNHSPKALSRLDIYRSTKNQFSALKEVIQ